MNKTLFELGKIKEYNRLKSLEKDDINKLKDELKEFIYSKIEYTNKIAKDREFYRARIINYDEIVKNTRDNILTGFTINEMLCPPEKSRKAGRVNSEERKEKALYLGSHKEVCFSEIRPSFNEFMCIIKMKLNQDINVFNLKCFEDANKKLNNCNEYAFMEYIMLKFIEPVKEQSDESYEVTQFISNIFRNEKIDGIKYGCGNSDNSQHFNLALFDDCYIDKNEENLSEIYKPSKVIYDFQNISNIIDEKDICEISKEFMYSKAKKIKFLDNIKKDKKRKK